MPVTIKDIMTTNLVTVSVEDTMQSVAEIFGNENIHHIPVVDARESLQGIISKTDFERIKHGMTLFRNPNIDDYNRSLYESTLVESVMSKDVVTVRTTDTFEVVYKTFRLHRFRALPVIDKGLLVGIVTPIDMLDHFMQKKDKTSADT